MRAGFKGATVKDARVAKGTKLMLSGLSSLAIGSAARRGTPYLGMGMASRAERAAN